MSNFKIKIGMFISVLLYGVGISFGVLGAMGLAFAPPLERLLFWSSYLSVVITYLFSIPIIILERSFKDIFGDLLLYAVMLMVPLLPLYIFTRPSSKEFFS